MDKMCEAAARRANRFGSEATTRPRPGGINITMALSPDPAINQQAIQEAYILGSRAGRRW